MASTSTAPATDDIHGIDPLDAYMDSLADEITQQAEETTILPAPTSLSQQKQDLSPSPAQLAVADKVASSPFCNVLPSAAMATTAATEACLKLLLHEPGEFVSRFGHILTPGELDSLLPSEDPVVAVHVARLKKLMLSQQLREQQQHQHHEQDKTFPPSTNEDVEDVDMSPATPTTTAAATAPTAGSAGERAGGVGGRDGSRGGNGDVARVRNRRYRRLQQLAEGGVWFSDEAMKERDPWLWFEYVGKRAGEEKPAPKQAVEEVPGSTSVGTYLQESLGFLSQRQPPGGWPTGLPPPAASTSSAAACPGGSRGAGSSVGMAFLSGVCAARDVGAGEIVDCSEVPAATPEGVTGDRSASSSVPNGQGRRPSEEDMETRTMAVTAAVEAIGLGHDRDDNGGGTRSRHRVRFDGGGDPGGDSDRSSNDDDDDDGPDSMQEEEEEEEDGVGREEVARILSERFLAGLERGVDYRSVDDDERLDDLDQLSRDEQDRWFRGEEDGSMD